MLSIVCLTGVVTAQTCAWNGYDLSQLKSPTDLSISAGNPKTIWRWMPCGTVTGEPNCKAKGATVCTYTSSPPVLKRAYAIWDTSGVWSQIDDYQPRMSRTPSLIMTDSVVDALHRVGCSGNVYKR